MPNIAKTDLAGYIETIIRESGSEGSVRTNLTNFVWDLFVTQPSATAPTVANKNQSIVDMIASATSLQEPFKNPNKTK